jgi:hypothetical protein
LRRVLRCSPFVIPANCNNLSLDFLRSLTVLTFGENIYVLRCKKMGGGGVEK